jgi:hypothetical protein
MKLEDSTVLFRSVEPADACVARDAPDGRAESGAGSWFAVMRCVCSLVAFTAFCAAAFDFVIGGSDCAVA